jgi:hypothetical protein
MYVTIKVRERRLYEVVRRRQNAGERPPERIGARMSLDDITCGTTASIPPFVIILEARNADAGV